jgi:hypothetical protein
MHAIDGGRRLDTEGPGFARLYADVFDRPQLALVRPPLQLLRGGGSGAPARARQRGCGSERRHLRVVAATRR